MSKHIFYVGIVLVMLVALVPSSDGGLVSPVKAQDPCSGLVSSRLQEGDMARVVLDGDGIGVALRTAPGKEQSGSQIIRALPEGTPVELIQGPVCLDGLVSWEVNVLAGDGPETGWVAEGDALQYSLEPFEIGAGVYHYDMATPESLAHWHVDFSGNVEQREDLVLPPVIAQPAREIWQQPDIDAANAALAERQANCSQVLAGTPWEDVGNAGEAIVPEGMVTIVPSPDGNKAFFIRHRVLQMPTCGGSPGLYYGISYTYLVTESELIELFPYGQHGGARSTNACQTNAVPNLAWTTDLSVIIWSPDSDTVAITARYLQNDAGGRPCAYYYVYLVDVFSAQVTPIAEARRPGWGGGGSRLYYFVVETDNAYNILNEQLYMLSQGETTQINLIEGVQYVPRSLDSTGVRLPWSEDGRHIVVCDTISGCPGTRIFEVSTAAPSLSEAVDVPASLLPRDIAQLHLVAGDKRLLWLTVDGRVFVQTIQGPGIGFTETITTQDLAPGVPVVNVTTMPTGISVLLHLQDGTYLLLNTIDYGLQALPELNQLSE